MKYLVIVEKGETSYGAWVPDLPGWVAVGETQAAVLKLIHEAIRQDNKPIPSPHSAVKYVEVAA